MKEIFVDPKNIKKVFMPSLLYMLNAKEKSKNGDLTKGEVEDVCAKANVALVELARLKEIEAQRNYQDISSENLWEEWQLFKQRMEDSMNKNYKKIIEDNLASNISAHLDFEIYKPNFLQKIIKNVKSQLVTKFGGTPSILSQEEWPMSRSKKIPMKFIGQIFIDSNLFPKAGTKIVYLFITDHPDVADIYDPESGENAVIIKEINFDNVSRKDLGKAKGPILENEYKVNIEYKEEPIFSDDDWDDSQYEEYYKNVDGSKISGSPSFVQREIPDIDPGWRLLLQLDSSDAEFIYDIAGGGVGYIFVDENCTEGKFLWQCD